MFWGICDKFLEAVSHNVESELKKIGLRLINVNVTDITDESGYIEALGKEAAARAINDAKISVAQKNRDGSIGQANAQKDERINVSSANASAINGENEAKAAIAQSGLRIFTVRGMVAFFAVGGWAGLSALSLCGSTAAAIITAFIAGTLALLLVAWFFKWAASLNENGTLQMESAVGKVGEVYITVPPEMNGTGKVNIIIQGRLTEAEAMTDSERPLKYGEPVEVVGMAVGNVLKVRPVSK